MRDVAAGEELCFDYAMTDTDDYDEFDVLVRHAAVPGHVTGADWKEPELRDRYRGWHSAYIARRDSSRLGARASKDADRRRYRRPRWSPASDSSRR